MNDIGEQQKAAWLAVCDLMNSIYPEWHRGDEGMSGQQKMLAALRKLVAGQCSTANDCAELPGTELYGDRYFSGPFSTAQFTKEEDELYTRIRANLPAVLAALSGVRTADADRKVEYSFECAQCGRLIERYIPSADADRISATALTAIKVAVYDWREGHIDSLDAIRDVADAIEACPTAGERTTKEDV